MSSRFGLFIFFFITSLGFSYSADDNFLLGTKYGLSAYYNTNLQAVDMRQLPSVADSIPRSAAGNSTGLSFGIFYEYRFTNRTSLFLRGLYSYHQAEISGEIPEMVFDNVYPVNASVKHKINSDLSNIKLEPLLRYRLFQEFSLYGGFNAGIRFSQKFEHSKSLLNTPNLTFSGGTKYITGLDENVESKFGIQASLVVGFGYDIPVNYNGQYLISPEVLFETGYSDIASSLTWDVNTLRLGFSFKYSINPTVKYEIEEIYKEKDSTKVINIERMDLKEEFLSKGIEMVSYDSLYIEPELIITKTISRTDTLYYPKKSKINESTISDKEAKVNNIPKNCLQLFAFGSDGKIEFPKADIKVEEFLSTSIKPLLNYVFFEENSSMIPTRYELLNEVKSHRFKFEDLRNTTTLETYYHVLNIIGKRLKQFSEAKITLTGYNSGQNSEKDNTELSKRRANSVKDYFVKIWKIDEDRISVKFSNLPEKPSNINDPDGIEENRRVEITSDNLDVIAPVIISDTLHQVFPNQMRFYNNASSCFEISKWNLEVSQSGNTLIIFRGEHKMPERLIWRLSEAKQTIPINSDKVIYKLEITDYDGNKIFSKPDTIQVDQKTISEKHLSPEGDKKIDKYSLILFDFDKADLSGTNQKILDYINNQIAEKSKVYIEGYTDRMGEEEYNLNLSKRRAANVASGIKNSREISFEGIGEDELIYNNELPEGRFYCRTVNITVETEIGK